MNNSSHVCRVAEPCPEFSKLVALFDAMGIIEITNPNTGEPRTYWSVWQYPHKTSISELTGDYWKEAVPEIEAITKLCKIVGTECLIPKQ